MQLKWSSEEQDMLSTVERKRPCWSRSCHEVGRVGGQHDM